MGWEAQVSTPCSTYLRKPRPRMKSAMTEYSPRTKQTLQSGKQSGHLGGISKLLGLISTMVRHVFKNTTNRLLLSGMRQGSLSNITEVIPSFIKMDFLDNGRTKPIPRGKKKDKSALLEMEGSEHKCLIRATNGKKKISTVVSKNC